MSRPKFLRRLDSDHAWYTGLVEPDGSLNARGRAALQSYRDARPVSRRALKRLHAAALRLDAEITRFRFQCDMEAAEDAAYGTWRGTDAEWEDYRDGIDHYAGRYPNW